MRDETLPYGPLRATPEERLRRFERLRERPDRVAVEELEAIKWLRREPA